MWAECGAHEHPGSLTRVKPEKLLR
jgi:hypothetical protein